MNYIVIEMQTTDGVTAVLTNTYESFALAEQKYHLVLSAAAVSSVPVHSCAMLNENGQLIKRECYLHEAES